MKKIGLLCLLIFGMATTMVQAHTLWINCFHNESHAIVSLGWGHMLPLDDIFSSMKLKGFTLLDPGLKEIELRKPILTPIPSRDKEKKDINVYDADFATQKIVLNKDSAAGVYQLAAVSLPNYWTEYIDKKGRKRVKTKPMDEVDDIDKIIGAMKYQAFAKTYLTHGEWHMPEPLGHGLEITPRTDLSNLHAGDMVEVEVLFNGEPLTATYKGFPCITASSTSYGQIDKFRLMSYIGDGQAQMRLPTAGLWEMSLYHIENVTKDGPLKNEYGKATQVFHAASLTFRVN